MLLYYACRGITTSLVYPSFKVAHHSGVGCGNRVLYIFVSVHEEKQQYKEKAPHGKNRVKQTGTNDTLLVQRCRHEPDHFLNTPVLHRAVARIHLARRIVIECERLIVRSRNHTNLIAAQQRRRLFRARIAKVVHNIRSTSHIRWDAHTQHSQYP